MKKILLTIAVCLQLLTSEALAKSTNATIGETVFAQQSNKWEYLKEVSIYWSTGELKGRKYIETRKADCYVRNYNGEREYMIVYYLGTQAVKYTANPNYYYKKTTEWYGKYQYVANGYYFNL